jgi:hypothetical protein
MTISATSQGLKPGVCTSSNRPANPFDGMMIYETDTNLVRIWNGSAWKTLAYSDYTSGSVIQVASAVKTDTFAGTTGATWLDIPSLSVTITPTSTSSKVFVLVDVKGSGSANSTVVRTRLTRNGSAIYTGDASSNRPLGLGQFYVGPDTGSNIFYLAQIGGNFLDSPSSTSTLTYKVQVGADESTGKTVYINRTQGDRDYANYDTRVASSITVMEIAG